MVGVREVPLDGLGFHTNSVLIPETYERRKTIPLFGVLPTFCVANSTSEVRAMFDVRDTCDR